MWKRNDWYFVLFRYEWIISGIKDENWYEKVEKISKIGKIRN